MVNGFVSNHMYIRSHPEIRESNTHTSLVLTLHSEFVMQTPVISIFVVMYPKGLHGLQVISNAVLSFCLQPPAKHLHLFESLQIAVALGNGNSFVVDLDGLVKGSSLL